MGIIRKGPGKTTLAITMSSETFRMLEEVGELSGMRSACAVVRP